MDAPANHLRLVGGPVLPAPARPAPARPDSVAPGTLRLIDRAASTADSVELSPGARAARGGVPTTKLNSLVAGAVPGRVDFAPSPASPGAAPADPSPGASGTGGGVPTLGASPAGASALRMYARPADQNAAATGVRVGRSIDVRG